MKQDIDWKKKNDSFFFIYIIPSIMGHTKIIDEHLSDPKADFLQTVLISKIVFNDQDANYPDYRIKRRYTLLI